MLQLIFIGEIILYDLILGSVYRNLFWSSAKSSISLPMSQIKDVHKTSNYVTQTYRMRFWDKTVMISSIKCMQFSKLEKGIWYINLFELSICKRCISFPIVLHALSKWWYLFLIENKLQTIIWHYTLDSTNVPIESKNRSIQARHTMQTTHCELIASGNI